MTKRSTANANTEKSIPPAMSQQNQHLTHAMLRKPATTTPKQFQTTWCFGKDWQHAGGGRDLQSATVFPESCHSVHLQEYCFLLKLRNFSQKRSLQQSHFRGRKHIGFLDSKKWSSPVQHVDVCVILPAFLWFHGFWRTFEAAGCVPSVMSQPKNRIATRSNSWIWRARFGLACY